MTNMAYVSVVYTFHDHLEICSIHENDQRAVAALRVAGTGHLIAHIRWGEDVSEAIKEWEGRPTKKTIHGINYVDDEIGCGHGAYNDPVIITNNLDKITCEKCIDVLIRKV